MRIWKSTWIKIMLPVGCLTTVFFLVARLTVINSAKLPDKESLRATIAQNIQMPFEYDDTLLVLQDRGICGNSSDDELRRHYTPHVEQPPFIDIIRQNFNGKAFADNDSLKQVLDSIYSYLPDSVSPYWLFRNNKAAVKIQASAITTSSVMVYEHYYYKDSTILLRKVFAYRNKQWQLRSTTNQ